MGPYNYTARDGNRELRFSGYLIGSSSSWAVGKRRWAEIDIYRTTGGAYVVAGVGRSAVPGEQDRFWAQASDSPEAVVRRLYLSNDGSRYLPQSSKVALEQAAGVDERMAKAYRVETIL